MARFLAGGVANTVATYALYLALQSFLHYQVAYGISFASGILLAYVLNLRFVFRTSHSWRKFMLYPLGYFCTYLVGAAAVGLFVGRLSVAQSVAPIGALGVTVPVAYVVNRLILTRLN